MPNGIITGECVKHAINAVWMMCNILHFDLCILHPKPDVMPLLCVCDDAHLCPVSYRLKEMMACSYIYELSPADLNVRMLQLFVQWIRSSCWIEMLEDTYCSLVSASLHWFSEPMYFLACSQVALLFYINELRWFCEVMFPHVLVISGPFTSLNEFKTISPQRMTFYYLMFSRLIFCDVCHVLGLLYFSILSPTS